MPAVRSMSLMAKDKDFSYTPSPNHMRQPQDWEPLFQQFLARQMSADAAHDIHHVRRVVANAMQLTAATGANAAVVFPAAWLHDCVVVPKSSPQRAQASRLAAAAAGAFLRAQGYGLANVADIEHAIAAHSFSAGISPRTLEAQIVQDADRLDALGAIGIARCIQVGTAAARPLYHAADPFCHTRQPDDNAATVDHFYTKLLRLADAMQTEAGRAEARRRTTFMLAFLEQLASEIDPGES